MEYLIAVIAITVIVLADSNCRAANRKTDRHYRRVREDERRAFELHVIGVCAVQEWQRERKARVRQPKAA